MVAAQNGNLALVRVLIEAGACINLVDNDYGETALDKAASNEHQEVVDYLYPFTNPKLNYCQLETEGPKFSEKFNNNIQAIPILIEVLENDNFYHQFSDSRVFAARALGQLKDKRAIFPLIEVLKNENPEVQNTAIWALGEIGAPQAIKPLVELLSSEEELVRDSAKDVLRKLIVQFPEFKNDIPF
jgi:ankyrin repeat protein